MARDEWPLLGLWVTHMLKSAVDTVHVLDHASSDGTKHGLLRLRRVWGQRLQVMTLEDVPFWQEAGISLLISSANLKHGDWICIFDPDEFPLPSSNRTLAETLNTIPPGFSVARYEVQNWVTRRDFDEADVQSFRSILHRAVPRPLASFARANFAQISADVLSGRANYFDFPFESKVMVRAGDLVWLGAGAHAVKGADPPSEWTIRSSVFTTAHLPFLSRRRLEKKLLQGKRLREAGFHYDHGWQSRMVCDAEETSRLDLFWHRHSIPPEKAAPYSEPMVTEDNSLSIALETSIQSFLKTESSAEENIQSNELSEWRATSTHLAVGYRCLKAIRDQQILGDALAAKVERLQSELNEIRRTEHAHAKSLAETIEAISRSKCWRVTAPVRMLGDVAKQLYRIPARIARTDG